MYVCVFVYFGGKSFYFLLIVWLTVDTIAYCCCFLRWNSLFCLYVFVWLVWVSVGGARHHCSTVSVFVWECLAYFRGELARNREYDGDDDYYYYYEMLLGWWWLCGGFWAAQSAASGGVVACGSGAGQGIYVTTNESTIVARSCLLEMRFLLLLLLRQEEAGRRIPRTHTVLGVPADRSSREISSTFSCF